MKKNILFFKDRKKLEEEYKKWLSENKGVADTSFNVISFLELNNLLDYKKVKKYFKSRGV